MPTPLESALEAVARMSPGSEIDPASWRKELEALAGEWTASDAARILNRRPKDS